MRGPAYTRDQAAAAVASSLSFSETLRKLGVRAAIRKWLRQYERDGRSG